MMDAGLLPLDETGLYTAAGGTLEAPGLAARADAAEPFARRHAVFLIVLALAAILRIMTMIAYFPAFWHPDSLGYVAPALHPYPEVIRPVGYSLLLLWPLRIFHSVAVVAAVQHAFGLLAGTLIYALLRRRFQFAGWTAALAAAPVLLSAYEVQLEHYILSDTLFMILTVAALVIALWRQVPAIWSCAATGLLLSAAAITRTEGLPLVAPFALAALVAYASVPQRLVRVAALIVAFALPLLGYASWFKAVHGNFEFTDGGVFLASRVETFANCSVIQPPAGERWLCLRTPASRRLTPDDYLWGKASITPLHAPPTGAPFSARTSTVASKFAIRAIESQPLTYGATVWRSFLRTFGGNGGPYSDGQATFMFPSHKPETVIQLARANPGNSARAFGQYNGGRNPDTALRQPWVAVLRFYQSFATLVPALLAGVVTVGLAGICLAFRRRGGPALLPWLTGMLMLIIPAATSSYEARYVIPTVPYFCVAAALAVREVGNRNSALRAARG